MAGLRFSTLVAAFFLLNASADAHGFHAAFTVVDADAKSGALHVVHRMFTQDVDALIKARTNAAVTARSGAAFDAALQDYLRTAFTLRNANGLAVSLTWSRVTVAEDLVVAYFEATGAAPNRLVVDSQLLMETNPDQVNTVNVTVNGDTRTAVFRDGDPPQLLTF